MNFHPRIHDVRAAVSVLAGWHDIFTPWTLRDFEALQAADVPRRLTVGPWTHTDRSAQKVMMDEIFDWLGHHAGEHRSERSDRVRLFVMGADEWRSYDRWPPESSGTTTLHLPPGRRASRHPRPRVATLVLRLRPDRPDPLPRRPRPRSGCPHSLDNAALEARDDVLCFTSAPLEGDLDVIGTPEAILHLEPGAASADFFVRLCDVDPSGVSINVCDGLLRVDRDEASAGGRAIRARAALADRAAVRAGPTGCGCRSRVAPFRAGRETPARPSRSRPRAAWNARSLDSITGRPHRRCSSYRSNAAPAPAISTEN